MSTVDRDFTAASLVQTPLAALLTPPKDTYWEISKRPLMSLLFALPILLGYELGVLTFPAGALRNAADVWLRELLRGVGFQQYFLLPLLACGILLGWHHLNRDPWKVYPKVFGIMWIEALVWAFVLLAISQLTGRMIQFAAGVDERSWWERFVSYLGAGFYEEVLFRLMMLTGIAVTMKKCGVDRRTRLMTAIGVSSVIFAAVHYRIGLPFGWYIGTQHGDSFALSSAVFRVLAGGVFGCLFVYRGFGIVVGAHAFYDLLVLVVG